MSPPELVEPRTLEEAIAALGQPGAVPLAGATDLIPAMRRGEVEPRRLVNLKRISALVGVRRVRKGLHIGALTPVADLLTSPLIARDCPLMVEVARDFASPQIRTLATVGGNLCNAAPSADLALPLLILDARAEVSGPNGTRLLDFAEFFRGVHKTALRRGELLTAIFLPGPPIRTGTAHTKLGIRRAMDLAFVSAAAAISLARDGRTCRRARLALGAVAPVPMRARKAEALLENQPLTPSLLDQAAAAASAEARPISDLRASAEYRREMVGVLARRVLEAALREAGKESSQ